jgi:hypothetical protein
MCYSLRNINHRVNWTHGVGGRKWTGCMDVGGSARQKPCVASSAACAGFNMAPAVSSSMLSAGDAGSEVVAPLPMLKRAAIADTSVLHMHGIACLASHALDTSNDICCFSLSASLSLASSAANRIHTSACLWGASPMALHRELSSVTATSARSHCSSCASCKRGGSLQSACSNCCKVGPVRLETNCSTIAQALVHGMSSTIVQAGSVCRGISLDQASPNG